MVDLNGASQPTPIAKFSEEHAELTNCDWATEARLVCQVYGILDGAGVQTSYTPMLSIGDDGKDTQVLTKRTSSRAVGFRQDGGRVIALDLEGEENKVLMTREWIKETMNDTRIGNTEEGLGVEIVDVVSGNRTKKERPDRDARGYIADENGSVRIKIRQPEALRGMLSSRRLFYFRNQESDSWELLSKVEVDSQSYQGLYPVAVSAKENIAYAFAAHNGFEALYTIPLEESGEPTLIMSRDDADVDQLIRIGRDRRVVGASYATEKRSNAYIDPELKSLSEGLHSALPGKPLITIVGASSDENKLLIVASSDTDPGMTYLYDKTSRRLEPLMALRSYMSDRALGEMQPVSIPVADGVEVPGYLTLPPGSDGKDLPTVVLPHGGPSSRDE